MNIKKSNVIRVDISINYVSNTDTILAADELLPMDQGKFDSFLINACSTLYSLGFTSVEEHESNINGSVSYYVTGCDSNQLDLDDVKVIIFIRLSDHCLNKNRASGRFSYYDSEAQKLQAPNTTEHMDWILHNIEVNSHTCKSYNEALNYLKSELQNDIQNYKLLR